MIDTDAYTISVEAHGDRLAPVVDDVRSRLEELELRGYHPTRVAVSREAYDAIVAIRLKELHRGGLMLLGLEVVEAGADPSEVSR